MRQAETKGIGEKGKMSETLCGAGKRKNDRNEPFTDEYIVTLSKY